MFVYYRPTNARVENILFSKSLSQNKNYDWDKNQVNYKKIKPLLTAWKIKKDIIWEIEIRENAHAAIHLRTINLRLISFWNLYLRK